KAQTASEIQCSASESTTGGTDSPVRKAKEQLESRQVQLNHHRETATVGLTKLQKQLHSIVDEQRRLGVWEKIREFQAQLGSIDEEQVILNRARKDIARLEEEARVEEIATSRYTYREAGVALADKLGSELMMVAGLFN